jgi:hypothetical protein
MEAGAPQGAGSDWFGFDKPSLHLQAWKTNLWEKIDTRFTPE